MKKFRIALIISIAFALNIALLQPCFSYTKDQEKLVPLEKEILIEWVNKNCNESHENWESLIEDGRIKCNKGLRPDGFGSLRFVKYFYSSSEEFSATSNRIYIVYLSLFCFGAYFAIRVLSKRISFLSPPWVNIASMLILLAIWYAGYYYVKYYMPNSVNTIFDAVEENDLDAVKYFIQAKNVNPNTPYEDTLQTILSKLSRHHPKKNIPSVTALDLAAYHHDYKIAKYLAEFAPELNSDFPGKETSLNAASATGNFDLVKRIIDRDGTIKIPGGIPNLTPLHYAVCANNIEVVKLLADNSDNLDSELEFRTPIDAAIWCNNIAAVKFLLSKVEKPRNNPIETAISAGNIPIYEYLKNQKFSTVRSLEIAAKYENINMLEYLEDNGEFDNLSSEQISQAVKEVERLNALDGALFLYKIGANVNLNIAKEDGSNLLFASVKLQKPDLVTRLLESGFDPNQRDKFGYAAIDYANSTNNTKIINILKNHSDL